MATDGRKPWPLSNPMSEDEIFFEAVVRYGPRITRRVSGLQLMFQLGYNRAVRLQQRLDRHWHRQ